MALFFKHFRERNSRKSFFRKWRLQMELQRDGFQSTPRSVNFIHFCSNDLSCSGNLIDRFERINRIERMLMPLQQRLTCETTHPPNVYISIRNSRQRKMMASVVHMSVYNRILITKKKLLLFFVYVLLELALSDLTEHFMCVYSLVRQTFVQFERISIRFNFKWGLTVVRR